MEDQPSGAIRHRVQGLIYDGLQILRLELPEDWVDSETMASLDACIQTLSPMPGLGVTDKQARLYALTHALRVITEDLSPYSKHELLDFRSFPGVLARIEESIRNRSA